jgi:DnaA family protein
MKQLPLPIATEPARSFDNFMPGANTAVLDHLALLDPASAPVYLWGPPGSGKTHLLQALAHRFHDDGVRTASFDAAAPPPWAHDEHIGLIVLDDCDRYDPDQQQAAFALFAQAAMQGTAVAAAGRAPPVDLAVREDLRTRLGWGHVFALQPLNEAEVRAALRREADRRGVFLSDEVMGHLLTRFARDLKHLMALLDRLDEFSLATKRAITVPLLKRMLAEEHFPAEGDR